MIPNLKIIEPGRLEKHLLRAGVSLSNFEPIANGELFGTILARYHVEKTVIKKLGSQGRMLGRVFFEFGQYDPSLQSDNQFSLSGGKRLERPTPEMARYEAFKIEIEYPLDIDYLAEELPAGVSPKEIDTLGKRRTKIVILLNNQSRDISRIIRVDHFPAYDTMSHCFYTRKNLTPKEMRTDGIQHALIMNPSHNSIPFTSQRLPLYKRLKLQGERWVFG